MGWAGDTCGDSPRALELDVLARLRRRLLGDDRGTTGGRAPADATLRRGAILGAYRLIRPVGQGGMGEVWLAEDPRLGRPVAIKVLQSHVARDTARLRLVREAQAIAQIGHPNVVAIYDTGTIDDDSPTPRAFIAMEYVEGQSLAAWLGAAHRTPAEIRAVFVAAGRGLAAAHRAGQIHRDFKPANVMIGEHGEVKVLDFGIAVTDGEWHSGSDGETDVSPLATSGDSGRLTETGVVMGTPRYMSPEQHAGGLVTAASDQFSFCCALLEALQGAPVFVGRGAVELARAKLRGAIGSGPRHVPAPLHAVLVRGLQRSADDRWPSMTVLLEQIERPRRRRPLLALAVSVVGLVAVMGTAADEVCSARPGLSDARADRIEAAIGGDVIARRVVATLRDQESRLTAIEVASCVAHEGGTIDEVAFDRRARCLRDARREVEQATSMLESGDVARGRPLALVGGFTSADACADDERLARAIAPPPDAATAQVVDRVRRQLASAETLRLAGHPREALAAIDEARADAAGIEYPPIVAELELAAGKAELELGDHDAARTLEDALTNAESVGDDQLAATIAAFLVAAAVRQPHELERLPAILRRADATIVRADDPAIARGDYLGAIAMLHGKRGNFTLALSTQEHARSVYATALGPDDPRLDGNAFNVAVALLNLRNFELGAARMAEVVAHRERIYGRGHPSTTTALVALGVGLLHTGDLDQAEARLEDAVERIEAELGPTDRGLPFALGALGEVAARRDRLDQARAHYRRALAISEHHDGELGPETATLAGSLGEIEGRLGDVDAARRHLAQSLAGHERMVGREHALVAEAHRRIADVDLAVGDPISARAHAREAIAILTPLGATAAELAVLQRPLHAAEAAIASAATSVVASDARR